MKKKVIGWGTSRDLLNHKGVVVTIGQEIRYLIEPYRNREDQENMEWVCENLAMIIVSAISSFPRRRESRSSLLDSRFRGNDEKCKSIVIQI